MIHVRTIGILGGTFDPVHNGHVALARTVLDQDLVKEVFFVPAPYPPHKQTQVSASFVDRVAMLELALEGVASCSVSLIEAEFDQPSYTVVTIKALVARYPDTRFSLIIGADSLLELHHWYRYQELMTMVDLIVLSRNDIRADVIGNAVIALDPTFTYTVRGREAWISSSGEILTYLEGIVLPESSSVVKQQVATTGFTEMVPLPVLDYIHQHHLYMPSTSF